MLIRVVRLCMQKFAVAFEEYQCYTTKSDVHAQGWMLSSNFDFWRRWYTILKTHKCKDCINVGDFHMKRMEMPLATFELNL